MHLAATSNFHLAAEQLPVLTRRSLAFRMQNRDASQGSFVQPTPNLLSNEALLTRWKAKFASTIQ